MRRRSAASGCGRRRKIYEKDIVYQRLCASGSRTRMLAQHALDRMGGEITEVDLGKENIEPLRLERLSCGTLCRKKEIFPRSVSLCKGFAEAVRSYRGAVLGLAFPAILRII